MISWQPAEAKETKKRKQHVKRGGKAASVYRDSAYVKLLPKDTERYAAGDKQ
jgi:hypothetical protein